MSDFSFYHIADLHLDSPFRNISKFPASLREVLISAPINAFKKMVTAAIQDKVSFVIISGDIFDQPTVSLKIEHDFFSCMETLNNNKISVYIIYGNHDEQFFQTKRASLEKLENIHFFPLDSSLGFYELRNIKTVIYGMNYPGESVVDTRIITDDKDLFKIGIYHGDIHAISHDESYAYGHLRKNDLMASKIDYWALGHLHQFDVVNEFPHIVYPGTSQGRSMKPSECGDKGCVRVTVRNNRIDQINFVTFSEVAYLEIKVEVRTRYNTSFELFNEIKNKILDAVDQKIVLNSNKVILRVNLNLIFSSDSEVFSHSDQSQIDDLILKEIFKTKDGKPITLSKLNWNFEPEMDSEIQNEIIKLAAEILETEFDRVFNDIKTQLVKPKLKMKELELIDPLTLKEEVLNQIKRLTIS